MDVAPHPHIGLQTVTWLPQGEVVHDDSLGHESVLRPGGVNVMTSGGGIAHAEQTPREQQRTTERRATLGGAPGGPSAYASGLRAGVGGPGDRVARGSRPDVRRNARAESAPLRSAESCQLKAHRNAMEARQYV